MATAGSNGSSEGDSPPWHTLQVCAVGSTSPKSRDSSLSRITTAGWYQRPPPWQVSQETPSTCACPERSSSREWHCRQSGCLRCCVPSVCAARACAPSDQMRYASAWQVRQAVGPTRSEAHAPEAASRIASATRMKGGTLAAARTRSNASCREIWGQHTDLRSAGDLGTAYGSQVCWRSGDSIRISGLLEIGGQRADLRSAGDLGTAYGSPA